MIFFREPLRGFNFLITTFCKFSITVLKAKNETKKTRLKIVLCWKNKNRKMMIAEPVIDIVVFFITLSMYKNVDALYIRNNIIKRKNTMQKTDIKNTYLDISPELSYAGVTKKVAQNVHMITIWSAKNALILKSALLSALFTMKSSKPVPKKMN